MNPVQLYGTEQMAGKEMMPIAIHAILQGPVLVLVFLRTSANWVLFKKAAGLKRIIKLLKMVLNNFFWDLFKHSTQLYFNQFKTGVTRYGLILCCFNSSAVITGILPLSSFVNAILPISIASSFVLNACRPFITGM